jgi:uncharacterized CHY-type Zn-finger protein
MSNKYSITVEVECFNCGLYMASKDFEIDSDDTVYMESELCDTCSSDLQDEAREEGREELRDKITSPWKIACIECGQNIEDYDINLDSDDDITIQSGVCGNCSKGGDDSSDEIKEDLRQEVRQEFQDQLDKQERRLKQLGEL